MTEQEWKDSIKRKIRYIKGIEKFDGDKDQEIINKIEDPFALMMVIPSAFADEIKYCYSENAHKEAKEWIENIEPFLFFRDKELMLKVLESINKLNDDYLVDMVGMMIMSSQMVSNIIPDIKPEKIIREVLKEIKTSDILVKTKKFGLMLVALQKHNYPLFFHFYSKLPSKERRAEIWSESDNEEVQHVIHICTLLACNAERWDIARKLIEEQDGKIRINDIGKYIEDDIFSKYKNDKNYDFVQLWVKNEINNRLKHFEETVGKSTLHPITKEEQEKRMEEIELAAKKEVNEDGITSVSSEEG